MWTYPFFCKPAHSFPKFRAFLRFQRKCLGPKWEEGRNCTLYFMHICVICWLSPYYSYSNWTAPSLIFPWQPLFPERGPQPNTQPPRPPGWERERERERGREEGKEGGVYSLTVYGIMSGRARQRESMREREGRANKGWGDWEWMKKPCKRERMSESVCVLRGSSSGDRDKSTSSFQQESAWGRVDSKEWQGRKDRRVNSSGVGLKTGSHPSAGKWRIHYSIRPLQLNRGALSRLVHVFAPANFNFTLAYYFP